MSLTVLKLIGSRVKIVAIPFTPGEFGPSFSKVAHLNCGVKQG